MSGITEQDKALAAEVYKAATMLGVATNAARKAGLHVIIDHQLDCSHGGVNYYRLIVNVKRVIDIEPQSSP